MIESLTSQVVAVDTDSSFAYVGTLTGVDAGWLKLEDVVVFDRNEARIPWEKFLIECKEFGLTSSRQTSMVQLPHVMSVTPFDDIVVP